MGIEIRTDGIALAKAEPARQGAPTVSFHRFQKCNAAEREKVLTELVSDAGVSGADCHLVLTNNQYQVFQIDRPEVESGELRASAHWKLNDLIDYPLDDAISDVFDFPEDASRGRKLINVVCARKTILKEYIQLMEACDLELVSIDVIDLALRNIAQRFVDEESTIGLLYLRQGFGMLVLVKGNTLYLSRKMEVREESLRDPAQQEAVVQQLSLEMQRSLDYFESQLRQIPPRQVLLLGPDVTLPLAQLLDPLLAVSVEDANFDEFLPEQDSENLTSLVQTLIAVGGAYRESGVA